MAPIDVILANASTVNTASLALRILLELLNMLGMNDLAKEIVRIGIGFLHNVDPHHALYLQDLFKSFAARASGPEKWQEMRADAVERLVTTVLRHGVYPSSTGGRGTSYPNEIMAPFESEASLGRAPLGVHDELSEPISMILGYALIAHFVIVGTWQLLQRLRDLTSIKRTTTPNPVPRPLGEPRP